MIQTHTELSRSNQHTLTCTSQLSRSKIGPLSCQNLLPLVGMSCLLACTRREEKRTRGEEREGRGLQVACLSCSMIQYDGYNTHIRRQPGKTASKPRCVCVGGGILSVILICFVCVGRPKNQLNNERIKIKMNGIMNGIKNEIEVFLLSE